MSETAQPSQKETKTKVYTVDSVIRKQEEKTAPTNQKEKQSIDESRLREIRSGLSKVLSGEQITTPSRDTQIDQVSLPDWITEPSNGQQENEKEIDTDSPEIRKKRILNQHELEKHLEDLNTLPFTERLTAVRQALFEGIPHVRGEAVDELRKANIGNMDNDLYVEIKRIPEYMNIITEIVDSSTDEIKSLPDSQKADAARRLAAVVYTLGIPVHPYRDGNGQTLRVVAESYLHELAPEAYGDKYFLYKLSDQHVNNQITTPIRTQLSRLDLLSYLPDDQMGKLKQLRGAIEGINMVKQDKEPNEYDEFDTMLIADNERVINTLYPDEQERRKWTEYIEEEMQRAKSLQETQSASFA